MYIRCSQCVQITILPQYDATPGRSSYIQTFPLVSGRRFLIGRWSPLRVHLQSRTAQLRKQTPLHGFVSSFRASRS